MATALCSRSKVACPRSLSTWRSKSVCLQSLHGQTVCCFLRQPLLPPDRPDLQKGLPRCADGFPCLPGSSRRSLFSCPLTPGPELGTGNPVAGIWQEPALKLALCWHQNPNRSPFSLTKASSMTAGMFLPPSNLLPQLCVPHSLVFPLPGRVERTRSIGAVRIREDTHCWNHSSVGTANTRSSLTDASGQHPIWHISVLFIMPILQMRKLRLRELR